MKEKDFQTKFNRWCKHYIKNTSVFELKITKTKSLPFNAVVEHQKNALLVAKNSILVHKLPDAGYQNPFDSLAILKAEAYVVIMFYKRGCKDFYMIDIDDWVNEENTSDRKSITEERAKEIGRIERLA